MTALIISNTLFNQRVGLEIACPITNTDRNFPFHVNVQNENLSGFVMTEQVKSIDYCARNVKFVAKINEEVLDHVLGLVESIIF